MAKHFPILDQCSLSASTPKQISIDRLSTYLLRNTNLVFPHRHHFYQVVLFTKGGGSHTIDFQQVDILPGQLYIMTPGQIHTWSFEGDMEGYVLNFDPDTFDTLLLRNDTWTHMSLFQGITVLHLSSVQEKAVVDVFERMLPEDQEPLFRQFALLYLLSLLEIQVKPPQVTLPSSYNQTLFQSFAALVENHYRTLRLPKAYAAMLYITPHHLNALCHEVLGITAGEVIRRRVLLESKRLLALGEFSIAEVAYALNFADNSYFTKFFKKAEGMTPEAFRMQLDKK